MPRTEKPCGCVEVTAPPYDGMHYCAAHAYFKSGFRVVTFGTNDLTEGLIVGDSRESGPDGDGPIEPVILCGRKLFKPPPA